MNQMLLNWNKQSFPISQAERTHLVSFEDRMASPILKIKSKLVNLFHTIKTSYAVIKEI